MDHLKKIGRLQVLTDTLLQSRFTAPEITERAIAGGADTIQYRQKTGTTKELIRVATELKVFCRQAGITFIINDRLDVALATQADGVHLGQDDFPIPLARKILGPEAVIGGSASTLEEARKCFAEGADYIGFGPVFQTSSKDDAGPVGGLSLLEQVVREIPLPIIAIGGINYANTSSIMQTGAFGIAVISAVCCQVDPQEATMALCQALLSG